MPQIQYSEKYYDDVYEYRCARIRPRRFPARLDALFVSLHATNGVRARSRGFPRARRNPRRARRRCPARYRSRARCSIRAIRAFERVRVDRHASRRLRRRVSRAREPRDRGARRVPLRNRFAAHLASPSTAIDRHVVLPPDIAKLLPKGRLLSEVRFRTAIRLDADATPERRRYRSSVSKPHRSRSRPVAPALAREFRATPRSTRARRAKRTAELTRASGFPSSLSDRRSGAVSACSSPAVGCTTPSTGPSPTSCCTGAPPAAVPRALFSNRRRRARGRSRRRAQRRRGDRLASRAFETSPPHRARDSEATPTPSTPPSRGTTGV